MSKQNSTGSRVYISPPPAVPPQVPVRVDYAAIERGNETKVKRRELELGPPPPLAPPSRVLEEPTRKGEEIGIDLGDFDMMDTLGERAAVGFVDQRVAELTEFERSARHWYIRQGHPFTLATFIRTANANPASLLRDEGS